VLLGNVVASVSNEETAQDVKCVGQLRSHESLSLASWVLTFAFAAMGRGVSVRASCVGVGAKVAF
jgi:hypothetical protein